MVKQAVDVSSVVDTYVAMLKRELGVERVILSDVQTAGVDGEPTDIWFIVVTSAFEGMAFNERIGKLAVLGLDVSPLVQAWGYTPDELTAVYRGKSPDLLLPQMLNGSREVYVRHGATPLPVLRKTARRKS